MMVPVFSLILIISSAVNAVPYGQAPAYTKTELKCTPYYETTYEDKCQQYSDRVCTTQHREDCYDVPGESCKAVTASKQVRKCFNVTELLCSLKEDVQYEIVQVSSTVQNCRKVDDRVCDTVYKNQFTSKDNYKCIPLSNVECVRRDKIIQDKTCKTTTEFDCKEKKRYGKDYSDKSTSTTSNNNNDYGTNAGNSYDDDDYAVPTVVCKKKVSTNCYNTPRTVSAEKCSLKKEKKCQKFAERVPFPVEKQHCHNEKKKVCELEMRRQPQQIKKYVYSEQCRPIHRTICENADVKNLVQSCAPFTRKSCKYTPEEKCVDVDKEHCYKVPKKIQKQKCKTVTVETDQQQYGDASVVSSSGGNDDGQDSSSVGLGGGGGANSFSATLQQGTTQQQQQDSFHPSSSSSSFVQSSSSSFSNAASRGMVGSNNPFRASYAENRNDFVVSQGKPGVAATSSFTPSNTFGSASGGTIGGGGGGGRFNMPKSSGPTMPIY